MFTTGLIARYGNVSYLELVNGDINKKASKFNLVKVMSGYSKIECFVTVHKLYTLC